MNKKSLSQILSIIFSLSKAQEVGLNEIKWVRKEINQWFINLFKI